MHIWNQWWFTYGAEVVWLPQQLLDEPLALALACSRVWILCISMMICSGRLLYCWPLNIIPWGGGAGVCQFSGLPRSRLFHSFCHDCNWWCSGVVGSLTIESQWLVSLQIKKKWHYSHERVDLLSISKLNQINKDWNRAKTLWAEIRVGLKVHKQFLVTFEC